MGTISEVGMDKSWRKGDGYDSHRAIMTAELHQLGSWEQRQAVVFPLIKKMIKAGLLTPNKARGPRDKTTGS